MWPSWLEWAEVSRMFACCAQPAVEGEIKVKTKVKERSTLGVIRLDYNYPPAPGDIDHPGSYDYDVFYRVVPGLTFEMCQSGKMSPEVNAEFIEAVKYLDSKGVSGITGDCGFMMFFQALARKHTKKPVFMSALCQLPAVTCAYHHDEQIAIFTANGTPPRNSAQFSRNSAQLFDRVSCPLQVRRSSQCAT